MGEGVAGQGCGVGAAVWWGDEGKGAESGHGRAGGPRGWQQRRAAARAARATGTSTLTGTY